MDIHENRGNAIKLLGRLLLAAVESGIDLELASLEGGGKHNAIPREAAATLHVDEAGRGRLEELLGRSLRDYRVEVEGIDDGLEIRTAPGEAGEKVLAKDDRDRLLRLVAALPHGVLAMSRDIAGLVETSSNLAVVQRVDDTKFELVTSSRSSVMPSLDAVLASIRATAALAGADVETHDRYPGWKPDMDSAVLETVRGVYREIWEREPEVTAVHAGLECGLLSEKKPGLDMVSFGPRIEGAHSPDERVHIASVERFWRALRETLARLAGPAS